MKTLTLKEAYKQATKGPLVNQGESLLAMHRVADPDNKAVACCNRKEDAVLLAHAFNVLPEGEECIKSARAVLSCFTMDGRPFIPRSDDPAWEQVPLAIQIIDQWLARASTVEVPE